MAQVRPLLLLGVILLVAGCRSTTDSGAGAGGDARSPRQPGWVDSRLIFDNPPFASCHASTIVDTPHGLMAAWFAGPYEKHPEVTIWTARHDGRQWLPPVEVANGIQADGRTRYPCWNPVLFQFPKGPLLLFYKVGPSPSTWWGMVVRSEDGGRSWSSPLRLPEGILGPIRCKPILLPDGGLLCGSSSEDQGWRLHMERTPDGGQTWERSAALNDGREAGLIQPTLLRWPSGRIQALCRSRQGWIYETWMGGSWKDWSAPKPTELPNPNSGVDAVMLKDGRALMVYNHTPKGRSPLDVAIAREGGPWERVISLESEPGEYSYPAVIQARDGKVHITYTWKRERIKHVVLDPSRLRPLSPP